MPKKHLNDQFIKNLTAQGKRVEYYDQHLINTDTNSLKQKGVKGLLLRLTKAGSKYFYYSYWFDSKSKRFKIGSYPNIGLSEARDKARELAGRVNRGIDPQAEKNKRKFKPETTTFQYLAEEFASHHLPTLRESTRTEYQRIIDVELMPKLKGQNVSEITPNRLSRILSRKKKDGSPTMANRIRAVMSSMFDYGKTDPEIDLQKNPAEDTRRYKAGENKRERVYNEDEVRELWNYFEATDEPIQSIFKMLLVTGQRKTETMRMRWADIAKVKDKDFEGTVWTIPAKDAKNKKAHEVPLPQTALEIIEKMKPITGESDFVFQSPIKENQPITWVKSSVEMIKEDSKVPDFRLHDLRRTAATYMAESGINPMVIGKVLNHKGLAQENTITARYNRASYLKQKQQALNRWNHRLLQVLEESEAKITKLG